MADHIVFKLICIVILGLYALHDSRVGIEGNLDRITEWYVDHPNPLTAPSFSLSHVSLYLFDSVAVALSVNLFLNLDRVHVSES